MGIYNLLIVLIGGLMTAIAVAAFIKPQPFLRWLEEFSQSRWLVPLAVAGRIFMGVLFLLGAEYTRFPTVMRVIGVLAIIAAIGVLVMGTARMRQFIGWWLQRGSGFVRAWLVFGVAFGVFIVYAALPQ